MSLKILLNAEPFGFGPAAMIADLFTALRAHCTMLAYSGEGHTLNLQTQLGYDAIYDLTDQPESFAEIVQGFDVFVTAMDWNKALISESVGVPCVLYDALAWYWPQELPIDKVSLYIAQDFYGVEERVSGKGGVIVPPIVKSGQPVDRDTVLLNLGGLQNPYWPNDVVLTYARAVITAFRKSVTGPYVIAANAQIVQAIGGEDIKVFSRDEIMELLPRLRAAVLTPGLGNIYDAAVNSIPTLFLPPANDSQGQQLDLLIDHGVVDSFMDWSDLIEGKINYKADQVQVLTEIKDAISLVSKSPELLSKLDRIFAGHINNLIHQRDSKLTSLILTFGQNGIAEVAFQILNFSKHISQRVA